MWQDLNGHSTIIHSKKNKKNENKREYVNIIKNVRFVLYSTEGSSRIGLKFLDKLPPTTLKIDITGIIIIKY